MDKPHGQMASGHRVTLVPRHVSYVSRVSPCGAPELSARAAYVPMLHRRHCLRATTDAEVTLSDRTGPAARCRAGAGGVSLFGWMGFGTN